MSQINNASIVAIESRAATAPATEFEVVICGAGPVGLATAALLIARGMAPESIALVDAKTLDQTVADPRVLALSYGSAQILQQIGAWPIKSTAIRQIHVSRRGHFGRTLIDREEYKLPALGYVARYGAVVSALAAAATRAGAVMLRPERVTSVTAAASASAAGYGSVTVALESGRVLRSAIVVQAEGGIFGQQAERTRTRDYEQTAIVAQVSVSAGLPQRAFERFTGEGPLALLPHEDGYALVWCVRPGHAAELMALPDREFLEKLGQAFGGRVGEFLGIDRRHAYALGLNAGVAPSPRIVAIGNAAQTMHPVAGQGLNLGLRDAVTLARHLSQDNSPAGIKAYDSARRADRRSTIGLTDIMARIFASTPDGSDGSLLQGLLGAGLSVIDGLPAAKSLLAQHMLFGRR